MVIFPLSLRFSHVCPFLSAASFLLWRRVLFLVLLLQAVWSDFRTDRIRNIPLLVLTLAGFGLRFLEGGAVQALPCVLRLFLPLVLFFPLWLLSRGRVGAGDIKLMMAVSSFLPSLPFLQGLAWGLCLALFFGFASFLLSDGKNGRVLHLSLPVTLGVLPLIGGIV